MSFLKHLKNRGSKTEMSLSDPDDRRSFQLKVDVYSGNGEIIVHAQLAGATVDDLEVALDGSNNILAISGIRRAPLVDVGLEMSTAECVWGRFYRKIVLPKEVDVSKVQANMDAGVLTLRLPLLNN
tara:strand:+ start:2103 stop:2480 length:378 start_codon:yes stop_codon:yes gene_type:complete